LPRNRTYRRNARRSSKKESQIFTFPVLAILVLGVFISLFVVLTKSSQDTRISEEPIHIANRDQMFQNLISTHPEQEIRENLMQLFRSREVIYTFHNITDSDAAFGLADWKDVNQGSTGKEGLVPMFILGENFISRPESNLIKQSMILHEHEHYKDWRDKVYPAYTYLPGPALTTEKEVAMFYKGEVHAYSKQCIFLGNYKGPDLPSICQIFQKGGPQALRFAVADEFMQKEDYKEFSALLFRLANNQE
jgi:hypothetical protein